MTQSMLPKAKAKAVPAKKKAKVAKSKAKDLKKFKLANKWFSLAAMKAKAGPLNGELARVYDEESSKRAFGFEGKVLQHSLKDGSVLIRVKDSAMQLSTMAQYVELASNFKPLPQQKTLRSLNNGLRVIWLEDLGFGSLKNTDFTQCVGELASFKPVTLRAEHIRLSFKYLLW